MLNIVNLNFFETGAIAVFVLFLGISLKKVFPFLEKYCIPSPLIGGVIVAFVNYCCYLAGYAFNPNDLIEDICMIIFFTSVGFQVDLGLIKRSVFSFFILLAGVAVLIFTQNALALYLASIFHFDHLTAFTAGSISMAGGEGITEAFGELLNDLRLHEGENLAYGMCTLGVIVSALIGGPFGRLLIQRHNLKSHSDELYDQVCNDSEQEVLPFNVTFSKACYQMIIVMGIGVGLCDIISMSGFVIPDYIGAMVVAIILRNLSQKTGRYHFYTSDLSYIGGLGLSLYLAIDFMSLALWQLTFINVIQLTVFLAQLLLVLLFAYFVVYLLSGRDYDAAVLSAASFGITLGGPSSAVSSIMVLTGKYGSSLKTYLLVPIVGSMLADPINSIVLNYFMRLL